MRLTNILNAQTVVFNTGVSAVAKSFGSLRGIIPIPKGWTMTATEMASFKASLNAALIADSRDNRIYKLGPFHTIEVQNGDKTAQTHPDGSEDITRAATMGWRGIVGKGGVDFMKILQSFDNMEDYFDVILITKPFKENSGHSFWGTRVFNETTGEDEFTGFSLSKFEVETPMLGRYDAVDEYPLAIRLEQKNQLLQDGWGIETDMDAFGAGVLYAIQDVQLTMISPLNGSGTCTIGAALGSGAINLAKASNAATWANVARFRAFNKLTGAAITISSVTLAADLSGFIVDLDSSDTDYPASDDYVGLELVAVSTLATAGLKYYESIADNPVFGGRSKALYLVAA